MERNGLVEKANTNINAMIDLANLDFNSGILSREINAYKLYKKASDLFNSGEGYYGLAECFYYGKGGVSKNLIEASKLYEIAVDLGNLDATYSLAYMYAVGEGVDKDLDKSARLFEYAIDNNHIQSAEKYGEFLFYGDYFDLNESKGLAYLEYAANHGNAKACGIVGEAYQKGWGTFEDQNKGKMYLDKGCQLNDARSLCESALCYTIGSRGYSKNEKYGTELYKRAAELGDRRAQYAYALALREGRGTPKNINQWLYWVNKAVENGNEEARIAVAVFKYFKQFGLKCSTSMEFEQMRDIIDNYLKKADPEYDKDLIEVMREVEEHVILQGHKMTIQEAYGPGFYL